MFTLLVILAGEKYFNKEQIILNFHLCTKQQFFIGALSLL